MMNFGWMAGKGWFWLSLAILVATVAINLTARADGENTGAKSMFHWQVMDVGEICGPTSVTETKNGLQISLSNPEGKKFCYGVALAECDMKVAAQYKLTFRVRALEGSAKATLTPDIIVAKDGKWEKYGIPGSLYVTVDNREFKRVTLALNTDFGFADAVWNIRQVKLLLNLNGMPAGSSARVEIEDVRIVSPEETSAVSGSLIIDPPAYPTIPSYRSGMKPIHVYCDFDHDDGNGKVLVDDRESKSVEDTIQPVGFARQLFENTGDWIQSVQTPEEADVIVYSRARAGTMGARIIEATQRGCGLLIYGGIADEAIQSAAPMQLAERPVNGWALRSGIHMTAQAGPLTEGEPMIVADWRQYMTGTLKSGTILASYDDGTPALAEKTLGQGKILQFATGTGVAWAQSRHLYDRFLLRSIGYVAGCDSRQLKDSLDNFEKFADVHARVQALNTTIKALHGAGTAETAAATKKVLELTRGEVADGTALDRMLSALTDLEKQYATRDGLRYQAGASLDNFARFGWLVGEGLLCGNINNDLAVSNGEQGFKIDTNRSVSIPLSSWNLHVLDGAITDSNDHPIPEGTELPFTLEWKGTGRVEYTRSVTLESAWKNKDLVFVVEKGIDDLDEVYVNGRLIGSTTEKTAEYWAAPRQYRVPLESIQWDRPNSIRVIVKNLRGGAGFNSCPKILVRDPNELDTPTRLKVESIDWVHKTYQVRMGDAVSRVTLSVLSPFVLYDFSDTRDVSINLENVADYATWCDANGVQTVDLKKRPAIVFESQTSWTKPWLLLWRASESRPLLLVFKSQPQALRAEVSGTIVAKLNVSFAASNQTLAAGWPLGETTADGAAWLKNWPLELTAHMDAMARQTLNFPIGSHEAFAIDREKQRVMISSSLEYRAIDDQWKTPKTDYAFLPPLAGYAHQQKMLVATSDTFDFELPTKYGPLLGTTRRPYVRWSLPLPGRENFLFTGVSGDEPLNAVIDGLFAQSVNYSAGGGMPFTAWSPAHPYGEKNQASNINVFGWCFGLTDVAQGYLGLNPDNRIKASQRIETRYLKPLELYQYKNFVRHRQEPFSGLRYPVLLNGVFINRTPYAPGLGSKVIYGDANEACMVAVLTGQILADTQSNRQLILRNWSYYRYVMRYMLSMDDWAFNTSSCREYGNGSWIDMLDCEYPCLMAYARLAEIAGDQAVADQAAYRAAKRMLPTLMRLKFRDYLVAQRLIPANSSVGMVTGFSEDIGAMPQTFPTTNGNFYAANDLFNSSQGFPGTLSELYSRYALADIQAYLKRYALPSLVNDSGVYVGNQLNYLEPLAFYLDTPKPPLRQWAADILKKSQWLSHDWPGMCATTVLGAARWRFNDRFNIADCRGMDLREALYHPDTGVADLEYAGSTAESTLAVSCDLKLLEITHNGRKISLLQKSGVIQLPIADGVNRVKMTFQRP